MINLFNMKREAKIALNYREIKWNPERVSNIKPFRNKYNWNGIKYPSKINDSKTFEKIVQQLLLMFSVIKKWKFAQLIFQKLTQIVKNKSFS